MHVGHKALGVSHYLKPKVRVQCVMSVKRSWLVCLDQSHRSHCRFTSRSVSRFANHLDQTVYDFTLILFECINPIFFRCYKTLSFICHFYLLDLKRHLFLRRKRMPKQNQQSTLFTSFFPVRLLVSVFFFRAIPFSCLYQYLQKTNFKPVKHMCEY